MTPLLNAPSLKGVIRRGHDLRCDCGAPLNSQACCVITGWVGTDCNRASRQRADGDGEALRGRDDVDAIKQDVQDARRDYLRHARKLGLLKRGTAARGHRAACIIINDPFFPQEPTP
jgi:hypothetical protein